MESYWKTLPFDIVTEILQFDGRIKRRKDSFVDQIDVNGDVYQLVRETLAKKVDAKKNMMIDGERYYIDIPLSITFGVIYDNKWYGRETIVSFYRDIRKSTWYSFLDPIYLFCNIYHSYYTIENTEVS